MPLETIPSSLAWALERRCLFLFLAILLLLIAVPFLSDTTHGPIILTLVNVLILLTAVAAVGRNRFSVAILFARLTGMYPIIEPKR